METRLFFRVQGGEFPNISKKYLRVENNKIVVDEALRYEKWLYIGKPEHMQYFLRKRTGIHKTTSRLIKLGINLSDEIPYKVQVVCMVVPKWFDILLRDVAQEKDEGERKNKYLPQLVDRSTPGDSYGISGYWRKLLLEVIVDAKQFDIRTYEDFWNMLEYSYQQPSDLECNINYSKVVSFIYKFNKYDSHKISDKVLKMLQKEIPNFAEIWEKLERGSEL